MRTVLALLCLITTTAHADSFEDHDTLGLDVVTAWEPANGDAFGAGPLFRFETFTSRLPTWLGVVTRFGMIVDSADRIYAPVAAGIAIRPGTSRLYGTLEGGGTLARRDDMNVYDVDWMASASLGYRIANWDLRASAAVGGMFERAVWMFSLGHDFVRLDSTTTRTNLFP